MKKIYLSLLFLVSFGLVVNAQTSLFSENFDDVPLMLSTGGWTQVNNSLPLGLEIWHNGTFVGIPAFNGASDSYAEVGFQSTTASGDISNWLISPPMMLNNGDMVSFVTTCYNNSTFPDRLELRLNPLNTANVGTTTTSVGDFTVLITSVNPNLLPDTAFYPEGYWGLITGSVSGLTGATNCRLAFRYFVTDGGSAGLNSSTIGVDAFAVTTIVGVQELESFKTALYPNPAQDLLTLSWSQSLTDNTVVSIYNSLGQKVSAKNLSKGVQQTTMDVTHLSKGIYTVFLNGTEGYSRSTFVKN